MDQRSVVAGLLNRGPQSKLGLLGLRCKEDRFKAVADMESTAEATARPRHTDPQGPQDERAGRAADHQTHNMPGKLKRTVVLACSVLLAEGPWSPLSGSASIAMGVVR